MKDNSVATCNEGAKASCGISPSKRANLRTESIKQLVEWHSLLDLGGISQVCEDLQQATEVFRLVEGCAK